MRVEKVNGGGVISGHLQRVKHVRVENRRVRDARKRSKMEKAARNECKKPYKVCTEIIRNARNPTLSHCFYSGIRVY